MLHWPQWEVDTLNITVNLFLISQFCKTNKAELKKHVFETVLKITKPFQTVAHECNTAQQLTLGYQMSWRLTCT